MQYQDIVQELGLVKSFSANVATHTSRFTVSLYFFQKELSEKTENEEDLMSRVSQLEQTRSSLQEEKAQLETKVEDLQKELENEVNEYNQGCGFIN